MIVLTAVAFIAVGFAYIASTENGGNNPSSDYVVLSQTNYTFNQNGLRIDTETSDVGTAYIVNYAERLLDKTGTNPFLIDNIVYYGYKVGTDDLKVTSVGDSVTSPIKVSVNTFGHGFKDFSDNYLGWRYVMKIEGEDNNDNGLLWYACYDGKPPEQGSQDELVGWTIFKDMGEGVWERVSYLDVYFGDDIDDYTTTLYIAGPGETIRDGSMIKAAEDSVKATGNTSIKAIWVAKTDSDHKITLSSGTESYRFYGWIKADSAVDSMVVYEESKKSQYIQPNGDIATGGHYYAVYEMLDTPAYKETYYEWTGENYEWTTTRDNDGKADRYKHVSVTVQSSNESTTYYFVGWFESTEPPASPEGHSATAYIAPGSDVSVMSDHTFYAVYYVTKTSGYQETYWEWNGASYSEVGIRENDGAVDRVNIEQFTYSDTESHVYTFRGWKATSVAPTNPLTDVPDYLPGQVIGTKSNHNFYALYQEVDEAEFTETYYEWDGVGLYYPNHTLTYVSINDGVADLQRVATITVGNTVYAFRGWTATMPSPVTEDLPRIAPDDNVDPLQNVSYYAVYIQVAVNYTETYYEWDGEGYSRSITSIGDGRTDDPWTTMIVKSDGTTTYTFDGWYKPDPHAEPTTPKDYDSLSVAEKATFIHKDSSIAIGDHDYYAVYVISIPDPAATYHEWNGTGYSVKNVGRVGTGMASDAMDKYIQASIAKNDKEIYISGSTYVLPDKSILDDADQPTGKGFLGWSYNGKTYMPGQRLTSIKTDIEISAIWGSKVTIKYSAGIGKGTKASDSELPGTQWQLPDGSDFRYYKGDTPPEDPENDDMFFLRWAVIIGNNDPVFYDAGEEITITYGMTLEAQYGFKVKFSSGHEAATGSMAPIIVEPGTTFILPNFGYSLSGHAPRHWMHDSHSGSPEHEEYYSPGDQLIATMNFELRVQWATEYCTVSFDPNGGTGTMDSRTVVVGAKYVLPLNGFTSPASSYFVGWQIGETVYPVGTKITISANKTVKAVWNDSVQKVVIKYDRTGMEGVTGEMVTFELSYGSSFVLDNNEFAKTDSGFLHWEIGTESYDPGTVIKTDSTGIAQDIDDVMTVTITPVFGSTGVHTLTLKSEYGLNRTYKLDDGAKFILPNVYFVRTNHLSHEWICDIETGSVVTTEYHSPGDVLTVDYNIDVMVEWAEILVDNRAYTIHFDKNYAGEGSGTMDDVTLAPKTAYVLPECSFKRTGFVFDKWKIGDKEYSPGSVINAVSDTTTVKALWKESVTVSIDFGCGGPTKSVSLETGSWFTIPWNYETKTGGPSDRDFGWLFKGWLVTVSDKWNTDSRYVVLSFISPVDSTGASDGFMIKNGTVKFIYDSNNQQTLQDQN